MKPISLVQWSALPDRHPTGALVGGVDLVIVRTDNSVSVLYGRCLHRGAMLADGHVSGDDLICDLHGWDYRIESGISAYNNSEQLQAFTSWVEDDSVMVDADEITAWENQHPQPYSRDSYQGAYQDHHGADEEPHVGLIRSLATNGLTSIGHHGPVASMGVPRDQLPRWESIQFVTAQLARRPLLDYEPVSTRTIIGPGAAKPLALDIPLFVSDMSFGALSEEAKLALAAGANGAGTGICSGEGGHAARGTCRQSPLLLRAGVGAVRLVHRQGSRRGGLPLQVRPGG